jgi:hypothetical protein
MVHSTHVADAFADACATQAADAAFVEKAAHLARLVLDWTPLPEESELAVDVLDWLDSDVSMLPPASDVHVSHHHQGMPTLRTTSDFTTCLLALVTLTQACARVPERAITSRDVLGTMKQVWSAPPFYMFTSGTRCVRIANTVLPGGVVTTDSTLVSLLFGSLCAGSETLWSEDAARGGHAALACASARPQVARDHAGPRPRRSDADARCAHSTSAFFPVARRLSRRTG